MSIVYQSREDDEMRFVMTVGHKKGALRICAVDGFARQTGRTVVHSRRQKRAQLHRMFV